MDSANAQSWAGMDAAADQDFGNLIDFDHFNDLDLPDFNNLAFSHGGPPNSGLADALDVLHHQDHQFPRKFPKIMEMARPGPNRRRAIWGRTACPSRTRASSTMA